MDVSSSPIVPAAWYSVVLMTVANRTWQTALFLFLVYVALHGVIAIQLA